jgi:mono/diheme cytochrome c family protein
LICHGKSGAGDGPLLIREDGSDGAYKSIPPNYSDKLKTLKDGEIYHTIVYGKNDMGGYATHIKPEDRWKLIHYIKKLGGVGETNASAEPMTSKDSTQTK